MRYGKIAVFFTAVLILVSLMVIGCGSGTDAGVETSGKPAVIFFWQPG